VVYLYTSRRTEEGPHDTRSLHLAHPMIPVLVHALLFREDVVAGPRVIQFLKKKGKTIKVQPIHSRSAPNSSLSECCGKHRTHDDGVHGNAALTREATRREARPRGGQAAVPAAAAGVIFFFLVANSAPDPAPVAPLFPARVERGTTGGFVFSMAVSFALAFAAGFLGTFISPQCVCVNGAVDYSVEATFRAVISKLWLT